MKFGYAVELDTTNMYVKFQSILQVLLKVMVQLVSYWFKWAVTYRVY